VDDLDRLRIEQRRLLDALPDDLVEPLRRFDPMSVGEPYRLVVESQFRCVADALMSDLHDVLSSLLVGPGADTPGLTTAMDKLILALLWADDLADDRSPLASA